MKNIECVHMYMYTVHDIISLLLNTELELARKQADTDKKMYEDLVRERDILSKVCYNSFYM